MRIEKTLVLIKPDGVVRNLNGKILGRFEDAGLKIKAMKMIKADFKKAEEHYPLDEEWAKNVFEKTKKSYESSGKKIRFNNHLDMGKFIQSGLKSFITEGPVVAVVLEGSHAIEIVRKMIGNTEPRQASPGTIRGDYASFESYAVADAEKRAVRNLVHASDSLENAKREISVWFKDEEIY
jgi:nucleoside-diphosphate kinase